MEILGFCKDEAKTFHHDDRMVLVQYGHNGFKVFGVGVRFGTFYEGTDFFSIQWRWAPVPINGSYNKKNV